MADILERESLESSRFSGGKLHTGWKERVWLGMWGNIEGERGWDGVCHRQVRKMERYAGRVGNLRWRLGMGSWESGERLFQQDVLKEIM